MRSNVQKHAVKFLGRVFFSLLIVFSFFTLLTCNAGLGNQVDTKSPTVVITSPATKSTLNGDFTITGTASDDLAVEKVEITFRNISTKETHGPYATTLSNGNWSLGITSRSGGTSIKLPDGDYNITATATDKSGHTSTTDVVYTIDTTPPTVLITSPTSYKSLNTFAKNITIKGEIYDASYLQSVYVYIVDKDGNVKQKVLAEGSSSFSVVLKEPDNLADYEINDSGIADPVYYYYVVATDIGGNVNSYFFHRTDIADIISQINTRAGGTVASFPDMDKLGKLDQGILTDLGDGFNSDILETKRLKVASEKNALALLSVNNYPYFGYSSVEQNKIKWSNVSSLSEVESGKTSFDDILAIATGVSVFGTVLPTSDSSLQKDWNVWIYKLTDDDKTNLQNGVSLSTSGSGGFVDITTKGTKITCTDDVDSSNNKITNPQAVFESSGSSFNLEIKSKDPANANSKDWLSALYWVKVKYSTDSGLNLEDDAIFYVSSDVPIIKETGFAGEDSGLTYEGYMTSKTKTEGQNKFSGTALLSDGETPALGCNISVKSSNTSNIESWNAIEIDSEKWSYNSDTGEFSYTFDFATDGSQDGKYEFTITATSGDSSKSSSVYRTVIVDTTSPTFELTNWPTETVLTSSGSENESKTFITADSFTVKGNAIDANNIQKVECSLKYKKLNDTTWTTVNANSNEGWTEVSTSQNFSIALKSLSSDFSSGLFEADYKLYLRATDVAGNQSESFEYPFTVDLRAPRVFIQKIGVNGEDASENNIVSDNKYYSNGIVKLSGTFDDAADANSQGKKAVSVALYYSLGDGDILISAPDAQSASSGASGSISISGTDENEYSIAYSDFKYDAAGATDGTGGTWSATVDFSNAPTNKYDLIFMATDESEKTGSSKVQVQVDKTAPEITLKEVKPNIQNDNESDSYYVNGTISVSFAISDEDDRVGSCTYSIKNGESWSDSQSYTSGQNISVDLLSLYKTYNSLNGKTLADILVLKAADRSGNEASSSDKNSEVYKSLKKYVINMESDKPSVASSSLTVLTPQPEDLESAKSKIGVIDDATINVFKRGEKISISVSDDDAIKSLYYKLDSGNWIKVSDYTDNSTSKTVAYAMPSDFGYHSLQFRVEDKNYTSDSNTPFSYAESDVYYLVIDDEYPSLSITTSDKYVSASFTLKGTVSDESSGIEKIEVWSKNASNEDTLFYTTEAQDRSSGKITFDEEKGEWSVEYNLESSENCAEVKPKASNIVVYAYDKIGRETKSEYKYTYDNTRPNIPKFLTNASETEDGYTEYTRDTEFNTAAVPFAGLIIEGYKANTGVTLTLLGTAIDPGDESTASGIDHVEWGLVKGEIEHGKWIAKGTNYNNDDLGIYTTWNYYDWTTLNLQTLLAGGAPEQSTIDSKYGENGNGIVQGSFPTEKAYYYPFKEADNSSYVLAFCYAYDGNAYLDGTADGTIGTIYKGLEGKTATNISTAYPWSSDNLKVNEAKTAWYLQKSMPEFDDGEYTIVFRSVDKVGNYSYPLIHYIIADNTKPVLTADATIGAESDSTATLYVNSPNGTVVINGTATENNPFAINTFSPVSVIRSSIDWQNYFPATDSNGSPVFVNDYNNIENKELGGFTVEYTGSKSSDSSTEISKSSLKGEIGPVFIGTATENPETLFSGLSKEKWEKQPWFWTGHLEEGNYDFTFKLKDVAYWSDKPDNNSVTLTRHVIVDSTPPTITNSGVTPQIQYNSNPTVNGKVQFTITVKDNNIDTAYYTNLATKSYTVDESGILTDSDEIKELEESLASNENAWESFNATEVTYGKTFVVDTTDSSNYYEEGEGENKKQHLSYIVKALDKAKNSCYMQVNIIVDQDSDIPTLEFTTPSSVIEDSDEVSYPNNIFTKNGTIHSISVNASDDDGVRAVYVALDASDVNNSSWTQLIYYSQPVTNATNISYDIADVALGRHIAYFYIEDKEGEKSKVYKNSFAMDDGAPTVTITDKDVSFVTNPCTLTGSVTDKNGISSVKLVYGEGENDYIEQSVSAGDISPDATSYDWSFTTPTLSTTSGTFHVYAYDSLGHSSVVDKEYKIDAHAPTLSITSIGDNSYSQGEFVFLDISTPSATIIGNLVDQGTASEQSGVKAVYYELNNSQSSHSITSSSYDGSTVNFAEGGQFTLAINLSSVSGDEHYVHIIGQDIAGNWSEEIVAQLILDGNVPTTTISLDEGAVIKEAITITGTATDDVNLSRIEARWLDIDSSENLIGQYDLSGTSGDWSITIPANATEGNRMVQFTVYDACEKSTSYQRKYKIDRTCPKITFNNLAGDSDDTARETKFTTSVSSTIKINIGFEDAVSGVSSLAYRFQRYIDSIWQDYSYTENNESITTRTITMDSSLLSGAQDASMASFLTGQVSDNQNETTDGLWRVVATVTDAAGFTTEAISPSYWVDQNKPSFTVNSNYTIHATFGSVIKIGDSATVTGSVFDKNYGTMDKVVISITNSNYESDEKDEFTKTFTVGETVGTNLVYNRESNVYDFEWTLPSGTEEQNKNNRSPFLHDGQYTFTILAYDKAGNEREATLTTSCDNDAPGMRFTSPYTMKVDSRSVHSVTTGNSSDLAPGTITVAGTVLATEETGGMGYIYYQLGTAASKPILYSSYTNESTNTQIVFDPSEGLLDGKKIVAVKFNGSDAFTSTSSETRAESTEIMGRWVSAGGGGSSNWNWNFTFNALNIVNNGFADARGTEVGNTLYTTYVYVVAKDIAGNINFAVYPINIDTNTDKPTVTIQSPDPTSNDDSRVFGGVFSVMGSATDDNKVASVWMQIEVENGNYVNDILTSTVSNTAFPGDSTTQVDPQSITIGDDGTPIDLVTDNAYFVNRSKWYRVYVNKENEATTGWNLKINNKKVSLTSQDDAEANESGSLRIFDNKALKNYYTSTYKENGYSEDGQASLIIRVRALDSKDGSDSSSPAICGETQSVTVKINAGAPSITLDSFPEADTYYTGSFDYEINLSDDGSIKSYSVIAVGSRGSYTIASSNEGNNSTVQLKGTLDMADLETKCGNSVTVTVKAIDNSEPSSLDSSITRRFFIDNSAPSFKGSKANGKTYSEYLTPDAVDGEGVRDSSNRMKIVGESSVLNGYVSEESGGSGVDFVAIWFTQEVDGETKVFSPGGWSTDANNGVDANGTVAETSVYIDSDTGLVTTEDAANAQTVYLPVSGWDQFNKNKGAISYNSENKGTRTPYLIIDTVEAGDDSGLNGDCDGYDENLGTLGQWYVAFDSTKLKDGIYTVNYAVVDNAKNVRYTSDTMFVMNNAPTFTGVDLKTDLKGSSSLADEATIEYVVKRSGSASSDSFDLSGSELTDDTLFKSMNYLTSIKYNVTGENGGLVYHLSVGSNSASSAEDASSLFEKGLAWDSENEIFTLQGESNFLKESGDVTFTIWVEDVLGLPSAEHTLTITMANTDTTSPVAQFLEFNTITYSSMTDDDWKATSSLTYGTFDRTIGHIEPRNTLPDSYATAKPTLSGKVYIRGQVLDDQRISSIKLTLNDSEVTVAVWDSDTKALIKASSTTQGEIVELHQIQTQEGHYAEFAYLWDTSTITGVAKKDVLILLTVEDASSRENKASSTLSYANSDNTPRNTANRFDIEGSLASWGYNSTTVDVVPYITKLYTSLSDTAGEEFARSATGKYIVRGENASGQTETVKLYGFNLKAGTNAVKIGSASLTPTEGGTDSSGSYLNLAIGKETVSGDLSITVNSVESLNNVNKNPTFTSETDDTITAYAYNSQANGVTNNRLDDDVSLWVWDLNYFLNETNITSPMMKMDKEGNYYMSYGYGVPAMYVNKNGTTRQVDYSYNKFHNTNVAYDDNGNIYAVATNTDRISDASARFVFYTPYSATQNNQMPAAVDSTYQYQGRTYNYTYEYYTPSNSKRHLELAYNGSTEVYDINRVKLPKISTYTKEATTYLGMAYFDSNNTINPVKARFGSRNNKTISGGITGSIVTADSNPSTAQSNNPANTDSSYKGYHIIASDNTTFKGGQYAAVGIVPASKAGTTNNVGVVAWYDASVRRVAYSYNTNPDTAVVGGDWQNKAKYLDGSYTGWYVDLAVDDEGGIHIAYYNSAKGDLKYVYLPTYNYLDSGTVTPVTVDSYLSVGTNITVNTRLENEKYVPYIYYYNASSNQTPNSIKVAWREDMTTLRDGAIDDKFTGAWESMTIPTENIPVEATVCGGVPTSGTYSNTVVLGYMSDAFYERAYIKK